jgi:hypothetical protein
MPDLISMLPFLKGWKYITLDMVATVGSNGNALAFDEPIEQAWLLSCQFNSNDAYATINIKFPPSDLILSASISEVESISQVLPPSPGPSFYLNNFIQPNPYNTLGFFSMAFITEPLPLPPHTTLEVYLSLPPNTAAVGAAPNGTTQASAVIEVSAVIIKVTDAEAFLKSLKEVFGIGGIE